MITYTNKIDMHPGTVPLVIHLGQYDSDFSLVFNLFSSAGTFTVESSTTAEIRGTKEDGNGYSATATIDISNKRVTVAGNVQMTAIAGENIFELVLKKSGKVLSTANFILCVERAAMDADTVPSESVIQEIGEVTSAYLDEHPELVYQVDNTLSITGAAADAGVTGREINALKDDLEQIVPGLSDDAKQALLDCFAHVAWIDEHGQSYYDTLEDALYPSGETVEYIVQNTSATASDNRTYIVNDLYFPRGDYIEWSFTGVLTDTFPSGQSLAVVRVGDNPSGNGLYTYGAGHKFIVYVNKTDGIVEVTFIIDYTSGGFHNYREQYTASTTPARTNDMVIRLDKDGLLINGTRFDTSKTKYEDLVRWMNDQRTLYIGIQSTESTIFFNYIKVIRHTEPAPEPDVPAGYTKYDWIKVNSADSIGGQSALLRNNQILLPFTGNKNACKYDILVSDWISGSGSYGVFGGRDVAGPTDSTAFYMHANSNANKVGFHAHGEEYSSDELSVLSTAHICHIVFNPSISPTKFSVDETEVTRAWANQSQETSISLALFGNPAPNASYDIYQSAGFPLKIGRFKVYNSSDVLVCDCIPCSNPSGKYGVYDKVSGTFLTSRAQSTYTCGNWS